MGDYQSILSAVGYPINYLVLDFESFYSSTYSLSKISTIEYVKSEQFELLGCGFCEVIDGVDCTWFADPSNLAVTIDSIEWTNTTIVIKNAKFDALILQEIFGVVPPYLIDIEDASRHLDSRDKHSLKYLAKKHNLGTKGETADFKNLHWDDMNDAKREALGEYCLNDIRLEKDLFELLLPQLTNPTLEIPLMRHTLDIYLQPRITFDFEKAGELMYAMAAEMENVISETNYRAEDISKDKSFRKILQAALGDEPVPIKQGKRGNIMALAQGDEGRKRLLEHPSEEVRNLMLARIAVRSWPLHIKRVINLIAQAHANGGKLAVPLKYYGAHTGRWSGSGGINLQNLGGKGRGKPIHPLIAAVRGLLHAG